MRFYFPLFVSAFLTQSLSADEGLKFYESSVRPLLVEHCYSCHSKDAKKIRGDLRLDGPEFWLKGGSSGPSIIAGEPDKSPFIQAIRRNHKDIAAMPPEKALSAEQIKLLEGWVKGGAIAPKGAELPKKEDVETAKKRWPFAPVAEKIPIPDVKNKDWAKGDIDRFILSKLEAKNITPLGDTDKRTLIRRVTFDLIGLPPTPDEIAEFLKDDSPKAFEKVVDRLLASKHYGERWGRHWLDVVRYADTAGDNSDYPIPQMYLYRNWVIENINNDKPFDMFVREQIAGDLLPSKDQKDHHQKTIATGYIANARRFGSRVDDYPQHLTIEDTIDNLGRAFLGLTLNCARCHDHKFDPVSMADYYGIYGILQSTQYPWPGIELDKKQRDFVLLGDPEEVAKYKKAKQDKLAELNTELKALEEEKKKYTEKPAQEAQQKKIDAKRKERDTFQNTPSPFPSAYAVAEGKTRQNAHIQIKGEPEKKGDLVPRKFLDVLGGEKLPEGSKGSGRLELAEWITSNKNPLFARVFVNRVWYQHFGRGIVGTPNDFGKQGLNPSHPELLDYLAREFINNGYSLKSLHKMILLSRTYQLSSQGENPKGSDTLDPNNDLLWKFRTRRLDAESIRDSLLFVSGNLDKEQGQAHPFPPEKDWTFTQHNPFRAVYETNKRSVYLMTQRIQRHPYLAIFDGADTGASTGSRITSTTTLQALYFMNDQFLHEQAKRFAHHLIDKKPASKERIQLAYEMLLGRPPTEAEIERSQTYIKRVAETLEKATEQTIWESYCRSLFRLNEAIYIN